jgi:excisionase family DNA binding protein
MRPTHTDAEPLAQLMTPRQLSDYLGVPAGTLANWRYQGHGPPYVKVGRHVRYRSDDVDLWLRSNSTGALSNAG